MGVKNNNKPLLVQIREDIEDEKFNNAIAEFLFV
jgi:hypothetical protein